MTDRLGIYLLLYALDRQAVSALHVCNCIRAELDSISAGLEKFSPGVPVFFLHQNRIAANYIWPWFCAPRSCMDSIAATRGTYILPTTSVHLISQFHPPYHFLKRPQRNTLISFLVSFDHKSGPWNLSECLAFVESRNLKLE